MKTLILTIFLVSSLALFSQGIPDQYLVTAAENNPELKARFNEYLAALEAVPQAKSLPDPRLAFGYFIQPVETRLGPQQARISLDQMFPWFGQLKASGDAAIEKAKARYEVFMETRSRLYFEVTSAYCDLYLSQKAVEITMENIGILNIFRSLSLSKVEAGLASTVDQLRIEMEIADMENQLALLQDKVVYQSVAFNNLLNVETASAILFPDTLGNAILAIPQHVIIDSVLANNHSLSRLDYELTASQQQEIAARKMGAPSINLGVDYIFIGKSDNPNLDAGMSGKDAIIFPRIGITLPLYRKKYNAMVQQAVYQQQAVTSQKEARVNALETLVEQALNEYRDAERRRVLYNNQESLAVQAMDILRTEYATDNRDFEEVLRMEKRVLKYALELERARADLHAAAAFLGYLTGK